MCVRWHFPLLERWKMGLPLALFLCDINDNKSSPAFMSHRLHFSRHKTHGQGELHKHEQQRGGQRSFLWCESENNSCVRWHRAREKERSPILMQSIAERYEGPKQIARAGCCCGPTFLMSCLADPREFGVTGGIANETCMPKWSDHTRPNLCA